MADTEQPKQPSPDRLSPKKKLNPKTIRFSKQDLDLPEREKLKAVAIQYDVKKDRAPRIVAAGKGLLAEEILTLAEEHRIPMCTDPQLTELLSKLDIDDRVPAHLYSMVAEILAFVYQLAVMSSKRKAVRKKFAKK